MKMIIREGTIDECLEISSEIPEFSDNQYNKNEYQNRLENSKNLILVAEIESKLVGFKIGYDKDKNGSFYSWMGGVLPQNRKLKIAQQLADYQEVWAKEHGFTNIIFKTRNYLKPMLIFGIKNGFHIIAIENKNDIKDNRIILKKELF